MTNTPESSDPSHPRRRLWRHPLVVTGLAVVVVGLAVGAYLFQPWRLFTNTTVDEAFPGAAASGAATAEMATAPVEPAEAPAEPQVRVLSQGSLISHEHTTTGTVQLLALPDDSLVVRVQDLDTSDGPQLKVWLTDAPVIEGSDGWGVFDDGRWIDLGSLKGNKGSANYPVPAGSDVSGLSSVSIWCDRFNVSFGAAELTPVAPTQS